MSIIDMIKEEEDLFPRGFTNYKKVSFGILFYNQENKTSFDSNHAVIYKDQIEDLKAVLNEIKTFYMQKDIQPSIYQAISDEGYFIEKQDIFEACGYRVWTEPPANFMLLENDNTIHIRSDLTFKRLSVWDERIASDICKPSGEMHEVEVFKKSIDNPLSYVFVGYEYETAVCITNFHQSDIGCSRFDYILVSKTFRKKGYARALLSYVTDYCRQHDIKDCYQWPAHKSSERICYEAGFRSLFSSEIARASYKGDQE